MYDLSASHHCGLLSYAIQQIMMHGNEAEVASIGAPLAAYFMVFHTLLASRLREVPAAPPARLASIAQELKARAQGLHCLTACIGARCSPCLALSPWAGLACMLAPVPDKRCGDDHVSQQPLGLFKAAEWLVSHGNWLLVQDSCCQSQHTYAYVQLLLEPLARLSDSSRYRRLSQA